MRCGTKCFAVTLETGNEIMQHEILARNQVDARKMAKKKYGSSSMIKSVRRK